MRALYDPVTQLPVILMTSRGESDEVWRADPDSVIYCLKTEFNCSEAEVVRMLVHSDVDSPVLYRDQAFWVE